MTNNVNIGDLANLAKTLLNKNTSGKDFMLNDVCSISRQAHKDYPEDPVIRQFAYVIEQVASKNGNGATINQTKMTEIFNDLVRLSGNTKFRKALGMLIFDAAPSQINKSASKEFVSMNRIDSSDTQLSTDEYIDQGLANSLSGVFGGSMDESKAYNRKVAAKGAEYVSAELKALGFDSKIDVLGGNQNTMVYGAGIDTRKGLVTVAIPLDVSSDKMLLPSTFIADDRLEELTSSKLSYFVDKKAHNEDFSIPNTTAILDAVGVVTGNSEQASDDEFSVNLSRFDERGEVISLSTPELFSTMQNYEEPVPYIDTTPEAEMPKELAHISRDFENDMLESVSAFGKDAVTAGKSMVISELVTAGFKNAQVKFGSDYNDSVCYLAAIHTPKGPVEIQVPVEMHAMASNQYRPLSPSYFRFNDTVEDFTAAKLQRFALNRPDNAQIIVSSDHSYKTLPELKNEILKSAASNNYADCEMILGAIQERFEDEDYRNAIADYHNLLQIKTQAGQEKRSCSRKIAAGRGSVYERCGHYGVSMDKVIVGEDGHCQLRSSIESEKLNPISESSASISSNKLYWS